MSQTKQASVESTLLLPDYETFPVSLLNATTANTEIVGTASLVFSGQLLFEVLEQTWNELVSAWPILSARVRRSSTSPSGLELQIPSSLRLDVIKSAEKEAEPIKRQFYCLDESSKELSFFYPGLEHGIDSAMMQKNILTTVGPAGDDESRLTNANATMSFEKYLLNDTPISTVQVTRFANDTMISVTVSHMLGDAFTLKATLKAWESILHGHGSPLPLEGLELDPFSAYGPVKQDKGEKEKLPLLPRGLYTYTLFQKWYFVAKYVYDFYICRPEKTIQKRFVFISRSEYEKLKTQTEQDLEIKALRENRDMNTKEERLSKSNILYAWLMKTSHAGLPLSGISTSICIVNCRGRGVVDELPHHDFFVAAFAIPLQPLTVGAIMDMPLGELALYIRQSITDKINKADLENSIKFNLHHDAFEKSPPSKDFTFFCPPSHIWSGLSDWRAVDIFNLDYGPALLSPALESLDPSKTKASAAPVWFVNANMTCPVSKRDRWLCLGDSEQGTWFTGWLSNDQWSNQQGFGRLSH